LGWKLDVIILTYVIDNHLVTPTRSAIASVLRIDDELSKLELIIFGSVRFLLKKVTKPKLFFFLKTETGSNRPDSVRFFREKTDSNRFGSVFARFFQFGSVFARFFRFGSVLARFGSVFFWFVFCFGSVWFFGFLLIKPKSNQTG
jgi:hypothetical protein